MKSPLLALFGLALLLAACDGSTQASTSSETQTALQELADNVRTPVKSIFSPIELVSTGGAAAAARGATEPVDTSMMGVYGEWAVCDPFQDEIYRPFPMQVTTYNLWSSVRTGRPLRLDGSEYQCRDGTPLRLYLLDASTDSATLIRQEYSGWYFRSTGEGYFDSGAFHKRTTYPSGFTLEGTALLGQIDHFNFPHRYSETMSFGSGRYQFFDTASSIRVGQQELCSPIIDLSVGSVVGSFCYGLDPTCGFRTDSVFVRDASGQRILPRRIPGGARDDSMGLRLQDPTQDHRNCPNDTLHLRVWAKTTRATDEVIQATSWLSIRTSASDENYDSIPLSEDALGTGTWVDMTVPPPGEAANSIMVSLCRTYDGWGHRKPERITLSKLTIPLAACQSP